jgi:hypothetical protein
MISPTDGLVAHRDNHPNGYYVLANEDRASLKRAQMIQAPVLVEEVIKLYKKTQIDS